MNSGATNRSGLLEALRNAADADAVGVLLVEQHAGQALDVADRVFVLQRGRVVMEGSPAHVLDVSGALEHAYFRRVVR